MNKLQRSVFCSCISDILYCNLDSPISYHCRRSEAWGRACTSSSRCSYRLQKGRISHTAMSKGQNTLSSLRRSSDTIKKNRFRIFLQGTKRSGFLLETRGSKKCCCRRHSCFRFTPNILYKWDGIYPCSFSEARWHIYPEGIICRYLFKTGSKDLEELSLSTPPKANIRSTHCH